MNLDSLGRKKSPECVCGSPSRLDGCHSPHALPSGEARTLTASLAPSALTADDTAESARKGEGESSVTATGLKTSVGACRAWLIAQPCEVSRAPCCDSACASARARPVKAQLTSLVLICVGRSSGSGCCVVAA